MAVWQWFKGIPPKTRMVIGVGVMAYAGAGLYLSDKAEEKFGLTPTDKDREELREALPKISAAAHVTGFEKVETRDNVWIRVRHSATWGTDNKANENALPQLSSVLDNSDRGVQVHHRPWEDGRRIPTQHHATSSTDHEGIGRESFRSPVFDQTFMRELQDHHTQGEDRGRTLVRDRATSPKHYKDDEKTRSQSPAPSFYHGDSPARLTTPVERQPLAQAEATYPRHSSMDVPKIIDYETSTTYQYKALMTNEIRLLRIDPGPFYSPLYCSLKAISLDTISSTVHDFQALSYAWGNESAIWPIFLSDLPKSGEEVPLIESATPAVHYIRRNLHQALKRIRLLDYHSWVWVDALCIEQANDLEKSQQIPKMPEIYSNAWNVIAWLGEGESWDFDVERALNFVPEILNLKTLDFDLREEAPHDEVLLSWVSFGRLLQRSWFKRRWVIQEVACARKLSIRIADRILSWLDFADAVDIYSENISQVYTLYQKHRLWKMDPTAFTDITNSKAMTLINFSRGVFRKSSGSIIMSRMMSLDSLVLSASSFDVSDTRDIIYSLLYLAEDRHEIITDYSSHPADVLQHFARYSIAKSQSLDIICRPWASWPRPSRSHQYEGRLLPTWIRVASLGEGDPHQLHTPLEDLLGPQGFPIYNASRSIPTQLQAVSATTGSILLVKGIVLGTVDAVSSPNHTGGYVGNEGLRMLGWTGTLQDGIAEELWRTLVADRSLEGKTPPTWYRRACALALTKLDESGGLNIKELLTDASQPQNLAYYLRRVATATGHRRPFRCTGASIVQGAQRTHEQHMVGLGPLEMGTLPMILKDLASPEDGTRHVTVVGPCYVHGHMEGEMFAGVSEEEIQSRTTVFSIH
ncbi:ankyrin and het domain-containing protein [Stemphylium lycopersici]|nr:ankyrin and het domain-containing protein [Stemphylium lycopersici]